VEKNVFVKAGVVEGAKLKKAQVIPIDLVYAKVTDAAGPGVIWSTPIWMLKYPSKNVFLGK
jgi:hypothetical protein